VIKSKRNLVKRQQKYGLRNIRPSGHGNVVSTEKESNIPQLFILNHATYEIVPKDIVNVFPQQFSQKKLTAKADNVRLLCSLTGSTSKAHWEDVTDDTPFCVKNNCVIFETRVSALFWFEIQ